MKKESIYNYKIKKNFNFKIKYRGLNRLNYNIYIYYICEYLFYRWSGYSI